MPYNFTCKYMDLRMYLIHSVLKTWSGTEQYNLKENFQTLHFIL